MILVSCLAVGKMLKITIFIFSVQITKRCENSEGHHNLSLSLLFNVWCFIVNVNICVASTDTDLTAAWSLHCVLY